MSLLKCSYLTEIKYLVLVADLLNGEDGVFVNRMTMTHLLRRCVFAHYSCASPATLAVYCHRDNTRP